jgi:hypothetical protein
MLSVNGVLDIPGELEIGVDVLDPSFVESYVGLSHRNDVGKEGLAVFADWENEGCWEGCGWPIDWGVTGSFCGED